MDVHRCGENDTHGGHKKPDLWSFELPVFIDFTEN